MEEEAPPKPIKPYVVSDEALLAEYQHAAKTGSTAAQYRLSMLKAKLGFDPVTGQRPRV